MQETFTNYRSVTRETVKTELLVNNNFNITHDYEKEKIVTVKTKDDHGDQQEGRNFKGITQHFYNETE